MKLTIACETCGSIEIGDLIHSIAGTRMSFCTSCGNIWETVPPGWHDLTCKRQPCDNCAFRRGSPEQQDPYRWAQILEAVENETGFYCHKGIPLKKGDLIKDGKVRFDFGDRTPLEARLCAGYMCAVAARQLAAGGGDG